MVVTHEVEGGMGGEIAQLPRKGMSEFLRLLTRSFKRDNYIAKRDKGLVRGGLVASLKVGKDGILSRRRFVGALTEENVGGEHNAETG